MTTINSNVSPNASGPEDLDALSAYLYYLGRLSALPLSSLEHDLDARRAPVEQLGPHPAPFDQPI